MTDRKPCSIYCPYECRYQGGRVKEVAISGESAKKPVKTLNIKETNDE